MLTNIKMPTLLNFMKSFISSGPGIAKTGFLTIRLRPSLFALVLYPFLVSLSDNVGNCQDERGLIIWWSDRYHHSCHH